MNVQFAVKDEAVYVLEVNPRASRTVPFVSKATGVPLAKVAARVMAGEKLAEMALPAEGRELGRYCVKEAVMPFGRFPGTDSVLGPEMKSTGEVMGVAHDFPRAYAQEPARDRLLAAARGRGVHLGVRPRQACGGAGGAPAARSSASASCRPGHGAPPAGRGHPGRRGAQGARGPAEHRRRAS